MAKAHPRSSAEKTLPLKVANTGFLLDRLGEDCHPLQFLRELTQNAIEAIQRTPEKTGDVVWDVDWNSLDLDGVFKLCVIDNGEGMTGEEMVKYVNHLSSSIAEQSLTGNFGVGAKISAATRNHHGLIYLSWKEGRGAMVHLWRDPDSGQYGLRRFERAEDQWEHHAEVDDAVKPALIGEHGTMVILMGQTAESDTVEPPPGAAAPSRWIAKYLNTRYFRFPAGVTLKAREGWRAPRADKDRNLLRTLTGQLEYLRSKCVASGTVKLSSAKAHWWILPEDDALTQNSGYIDSSGHVAALYRDELYETASGRAGMAKLQQFGILFGYRQVVVYVEPAPDDLRAITTNTARTQLLINSEPLPWADWAIEFRAALPKQLQALIEEKGTKSPSTDHTQSIRERLKQILDLYKVSRYRMTNGGTIKVDPESLARGGEPKTGSSTTSSGTARSGTKGGQAGGVYAVFLKNEGAPGEKVKPDVFPKVEWVSVADGKRAPGDIEDRAARYLQDQNVLLINADFRVFTDMIERFCRDLPAVAGARKLVTDAVHNWFEQSLVETVIGAQALLNSKEWTRDDVTKALSEEALTACVMPRYHVFNSVKREVFSKLPKEQAAIVTPA